jgi:hypothetical protein
LNPPPRAPRSRRHSSRKKPRTITRHVARTCPSSPAFRLGEVQASNARSAREAPDALPTRRCTSNHLAPISARTFSRFGRPSSQSFRRASRRWRASWPARSQSPGKLRAKNVPSDFSGLPRYPSMVVEVNPLP